MMLELREGKGQDGETKEMRARLLQPGGNVKNLGQHTKGNGRRGFYVG